MLVTSHLQQRIKQATQIRVEGRVGDSSIVIQTFIIHAPLDKTYVPGAVRLRIGLGFHYTVARPERSEYRTARPFNC